MQTKKPQGTRTRQQTLWKGTPRSVLQVVRQPIS